MNKKILNLMQMENPTPSKSLGRWFGCLTFLTLMKPLFIKIDKVAKIVNSMLAETPGDPILKVLLLDLEGLKGKLSQPVPDVENIT